MLWRWDKSAAETHSNEIMSLRNSKTRRRLNWPLCSGKRGLAISSETKQEKGRASKRALHAKLENRRAKFGERDFLFIFSLPSTTAVRQTAEVNRM